MPLVVAWVNKWTFFLLLLLLLLHTGNIYVFLLDTENAVGPSLSNNGSLT